MHTTTKPPFWVSKRFLKETNHGLQQQLAHAQRDVVQLRRDLDGMTEEASILEECAAQWRSKYEAAVNTPETKADTEAAFKRGQAWQKRLFASWLLGEASRIGTEDLGV